MSGISCLRLGILDFYDILNKKPRKPLTNSRELLTMRISEMRLTFTMNTAL